MYGYNKYVPLNVEEILSRTTEEEIYKIVIQGDIIEDREVLYKAPYRSDTNADCYFEKFQGCLLFIDFAKGTSPPGINCFRFIQDSYECSFGECLQIINDKLNLGLGDNIGKAKKIIHEHGYVEEKNVKKVFKERVITFIPRIFAYKDKQFWSKYEISKEDLIKDEVIPVELYQSTSKKGEKFTVRPHKLCYAYTKFVDLEGNVYKDKVKIYRPYASKEGKWFTNCNQNNVGGLEYLPEKAELLVITKSYKDYKILQNLGLHSVWFQNEGMIPSKSILEGIAQRFISIVVWFDNDSTGITNSTVITNHINTITKCKKARSLMLPPKLLLSNIKDPSDYFAKESKDALVEFLVKNNLK